MKRQEREAQAIGLCSTAHILWYGCRNYGFREIGHPTGMDLLVACGLSDLAKQVFGMTVFVIAAGGGDGTINAVANALMKYGDGNPDLTLGICPLGTANDFARGLELPFDDLAECLRIACSRDGRSIDVGVLNNRNFVNVASLGFGAEITATIPIQLKKALGGGACSLIGMLRALNLKPYPGQLLVPKEEPVEGSMLFMAVGNNHFAGGGFDVAPKARLDDGLLDLTAILVGRGLNLAGIRNELEDPMNPDNKHVFYRQLSKFTITSTQKLHCNLDGEPVLKKKLKFSVLPERLRVAF